MLTKRYKKLPNENALKIPIIWNSNIKPLGITYIMNPPFFNPNILMAPHNDNPNNTNSIIKTMRNAAPPKAPNPDIYDSSIPASQPDANIPIKDNNAHNPLQIIVSIQATVKSAGLFAS